MLAIVEGDGAAGARDEGSRDEGTPAGVDKVGVPTIQEVGLVIQGDGDEAMGLC